MEIQPQKLEALLHWLQTQAVERKASVILQVRIVVTPSRTQLLDLRPEPSLATILF
jgi:hypothetical protein